MVVAVVEIAGGGVLGHTGIHGRLGSRVSMPFEWKGVRNEKRRQTGQGQGGGRGKGGTKSKRRMVCKCEGMEGRKEGEGREGKDRCELTPRRDGGRRKGRGGMREKRRSEGGRRSTREENK